MDPTPIILMEDLATLGYAMHSSNSDLDLEHCLSVVEKLAFLHAASVAIYEKAARVVEKYTEGLFAQNGIVEIFISKTYSSFMELCEEKPNLHHFVSKMSVEKLTKKLYAAQVLSEKFNVLNHGDMWINNFMFRYDTQGRVIETLFVDFQYPFFGSPALDFHFFWAVCTNPLIKKQHFHKVFCYYHSELVKNLLKLQVKTTPPTFDELKKDFRARASFGFVAAMASLPFLVSKASGNNSVDNFLKDGRRGSYRHTSFHSKNYIEQIEILLPFYDSLGVFQ